MNNQRLLVIIRIFVYIGIVLMSNLVIATTADANPDSTTSAIVDGDWSILGRTSDQQHFSPLRQINENTVKKLALAWYVDLPTTDGLLANPLVADGLVYQTSSFDRVWAIDVRRGKVVWSFAPTPKIGHSFPDMWSARINRGVALLGDKLFVGTSDCRLIALDRQTGRKIWDVKACDEEGSGMHAINGAPRVGGGKVFIGNSDADTGVGSGTMDAFDAATGRHLWRFHTLPGDPSEEYMKSDAMKMAAKTWSENGKEWWKKMGGGSTWDPITYDSVLNLLYFGVDGPSPWSAKNRKGDNLFTDSIVAVNADTGEYVWHYQEVPNDTWDLNAIGPIVVAELLIDGHKRRVVMQAPKNGFFYVLDAKTGTLLSAEKIAQVSWASHIDMKTGRPVENPSARYYNSKEERNYVYPGPIGAHSWQAMSFSATTGLVYVPINDVGVAFTMLKSGNSPIGGDAVTDYEIGLHDPKYRDAITTGSLLAWDPVGKKARWRVNLELPTNGGVLSTAGNLVFEGMATGDINAYRADTGEKMWSFYAGSAIQGAPSTVEVEGEQLLLVPVGDGGGLSMAVPHYTSNAKSRGPSRLLAFKLDGTTKLPKYDVVETFPKPPLPRSDPTLAARGAQLFTAQSCDYCHGPLAQRDTMSIPDLRKASAGTHAGFTMIVRGGLKEMGMPPHEDLSDEDIAAIQAFVINQAWDAYNAQEIKTQQ